MTFVISSYSSPGRSCSSSGERNAFFAFEMRAITAEASNARPASVRERMSFTQARQSP